MSPEFFIDVAQEAADSVHEAGARACAGGVSVATTVASRGGLSATQATEEGACAAGVGGPGAIVGLGVS